MVRQWYELSYTFRQCTVYCSNLEGLGLPALETAIAGNKVIGYTEEGGKEYWKEPEGPLSE